MWTADIIYALSRLEEQFSCGNTVCIGSIGIGLFGCITVYYNNHSYIFDVEEDKWIERED